MSDICLKIEGLTKKFHIYNADKVIHACSNINLTLKKGEFIEMTIFGYDIRMYFLLFMI